MDTTVDIFSAVIGWLVTGYLTYRTRRQRKIIGKTTPHAVSEIWLLSLFLSLYFTLRVPSIAIGLDSLFPWHNSARLLAYICVGWAAWYLNSAVYRIAGRELSGWVRYLPGAMSTLLLIFFPFSLALSPSTGDELPATFLDLLFRQILYVYMIALLGSSLILFRTLQSTEKTALVRLRLIFSQVSILAAISLAFVKIIDTLFGFYLPGSSVLSFLEYTGSLLKAMLVLPWLAVYLPVRLSVPVLHAWHSLRALWILPNVRIVERKVRRFCKPFASENPTLWQTLRSPDYYATRSLIHILDGRKQLSSDSDPEVIQLCQRLDGVEDQMDIPELLAFYARLGRQMRRENRQVTSSAQRSTA